MVEKIKYPRTPHFPWSPGCMSDDKMLKNTNAFIGKNVVVTEKMDGENSTISCSFYHARSLDSKDHESRHWLKQLWMKKRHEIPESIRIHGENLYAKHSIGYKKLPSYFLVFGITEHERFLSWEETQYFCQDLGLLTVPVLYSGIYDEKEIKEKYTGISKFDGEQEGYVCRCENGFEIINFDINVAKYVRKNHIQSEEHWMYKRVEKNKLL